MAIYTKHDVRIMLYKAADQLRELADEYVQGRPADGGKISQIHLGVKVGMSVIDGTWAHGMDSEFPKRK